MATLNIDGIGKVKVDDTFRELSPEDQERTVNEIVQALQGQNHNLEPERDSFAGSLLKGPADRALGLIDSGLGFIDEAGKFMQRQIPLGGYNFDTGEWVSGEDIGSGAAPTDFSVARGIPQQLRESLDYNPHTTWDDVKEQPSVGNVLKFGAEQIVSSAPDMYSTMTNLPGYVMSRTGELAEQRAAADTPQGQDPRQVEGLDLLVGGATALPSALLERHGARGIFGGATGNTMAGRVAGAAGREALTEAVQGSIEHLGTRAYTESGVDLDEMSDEVLAGMVGGASGGGQVRAGIEASSIPRRARDTYQNVQAGLEYSRNPEQIRSDLRIADLYEARVAAEQAFDSGKEVSADETFKSITVDLERELKGLADTLYRAGDITKDQRDEVRQAVTRAKRHNYELGERGEESGYFDTEVDTLRRMDLPDQTKQTLINSMRDLNTAAFNSMKKNRRGPIEVAMQRVGTPSGAAAGAFIGGAPGAVVGSSIGSTTAGRIGRTGDQILGLDQPPILRRAEARRRVLEGRQDDYGNTVQDIQTAFQDARSRQKLVVTQQQAQNPQTPIDQTLRDLGVERQGGWVRSMVDYANQNLVPGQRPITQQDLTNAIEELKELGALSEGQAKELLDNKSGVITDERVYYGLQDYLIFRARQEAPGAGSDLTEGVITQETPQASPASPETPSGRPDAPQSGAIYNPLSYAQTMENVRQATNIAMMTAPGPMATMVTEVANARTREEKRQALENAREWYPEYREWTDQYLEPLTKFGPQETSSEPFRP